MKKLTILVALMIVSLWSCWIGEGSGNDPVTPPNLQYVYQGQIISDSGRIFNGNEVLTVSITPKNTNATYEYWTVKVLPVQAGQAQFSFMSRYKPSDLASETLTLSSGLAGSPDLGSWTDIAWRVYNTNTYETILEIN